MGNPERREFSIKTSNGILWEVVSDNLYGLSSPGRLIFIDPKHRNRELLDTWVHEGIHTERPDLTEVEVVRLSNFISTLLWKAGYRQVPLKKFKRRAPKKPKRH